MENKSNAQEVVKEAVSAAKNGNGSVTPASKATAVQKASRQGNLTGLKHTEISEVLNGMKAQISQALPKHLTPDRMIQVVTTMVTKNPAIAACSLQSLMGAVMQASILGFQPADALGHCYFVPYGGHVQFQIGYKGWLELARRSGQIKMIYAEVVREGDEFSYEVGLNPVLKHIPMGDTDRKMVKVYAVAHYKDGGYNFIVLSRQEIEKLRMTNPMQKGTPKGAWEKWYDEMAMGKAIKKMSKYMPISIDHIAATDEKVIMPEMFNKDQDGSIDLDKLSDEEIAAVPYAEESKESPETEAPKQ